MKIKKSLIVALIIITITATSCTSINQQIKILPITNKIPTSASSTLYLNGKVLDKTNYDLIEEFTLSLSIDEPISSENLIPIDLNSRLQDILDKSGADAITDLKFQLLYVDKSAISWMNIEQYIGFMGLGVAGYGVYAQTTIDPDYYVYTISGAATAIAGIGGSLLHKAFGSITYKYEVSGKAVKLKS